MSMLFTNLIHHYLLWHYTKAFVEIKHISKNFIWFTVNFFSLPQLSRSLFSPWKRITEHRNRRFSLEDLAGYIIINLISRIIGFLLRSTIIVAGLVSLLVLTTLIFLTYLFWILAPALLLLSLYYGIMLILI